MKILTMLLLVVGLLSSTHELAEADDRTNQLLTIHDVSSMQVVRLTGTNESRMFRMTDGYEERVIRKVMNWINTSSPGEQATDVEGDQVPLILKLNMSNGNIITLVPSYNCKSLIKTCTAVDGEIVLQEIRKKSDYLRKSFMIGSLRAGSTNLLDRLRKSFWRKHCTQGIFQ